MLSSVTAAKIRSSFPRQQEIDFIGFFIREMAEQRLTVKPSVISHSPCPLQPTKDCYWYEPKKVHVENTLAACRNPHSLPPALFSSALNRGRSLRPSSRGSTLSQSFAPFSSKSCSSKSSAFPFCPSRA